MSVSFLVAPSGFKESLSVGSVTDAIARGVLRALPDARILKAPMVDGGEGFVEALVAAKRGSIRNLTVRGPVGKPVNSFYGLMDENGSRCAVIEMAAAAGLRLVPRDQRDPCMTTSFGVGQLIRAALDEGVERILLGCGDSGINDAGAGMLQALGCRLLDAKGHEIGPGGAALLSLSTIDSTGLHPRLKDVRIDAAVNIHNVLLGPRGVSRVFGPQKGATPEQVELLERALTTFADCIRRTTGTDVSLMPGGGASGGLGAALYALAGGALHPRFSLVMQYLDFDRLLTQADIVITAEGSLDGQTPFGKVPAEVARRAKLVGLPVIALAGTIGKGCAQNFEHGIDAFQSILKRPCTLEEAIAKAERLLERAAEDAVRMIAVGNRMARFA